MAGSDIGRSQKGNRAHKIVLERIRRQQQPIVIPKTFAVTSDRFKPLSKCFISRRLKTSEDLTELCLIMERSGCARSAEGGYVDIGISVDLGLVHVRRGRMGVCTVTVRSWILGADMLQEGEADGLKRNFHRFVPGMMT